MEWNLYRDRYLELSLQFLILVFLLVVFRITLGFFLTQGSGKLSNQRNLYRADYFCDSITVGTTAEERWIDTLPLVHSGFD